MKFLLIDHYDSFTYNIYEFFGSFKKKVYVVKYNFVNKILIKLIFYKPIIIIGSGPKNPKFYIKTLKILKAFYKNLFFLGICLGHQIIAIFLGFFIKKSKNIIHGSLTKIKIFKSFLNIFNKKIDVIRYNSLTVFKKKKIKTKILSNELKSKEIMIIYNKKFKILSFQYHIESFFSKLKKKLIKNYLNEISIKKH
ncbi:aminodeoxychorismate/anthranilate synthase component II [Candidatus Vidania fulgoroideorum]